MKKLLLLLVLVSNLSFGQEAAYHLNGIDAYLGDNFLEKENGIYYTNLNDFSLSYLPKNGQPGWKKRLSLPAEFSCAKSTMAFCNSSNNIIVSVQTSLGNQNLIIKFDLDGNLIWEKLMSYTAANEYGSNSTPLIINNQDEIIISITQYDALLLSKLDTNGNLIFSKRINSSDYMNNDYKNPGFSVITTADNGYLITMKNGSNPTITKLNSNLQVIWSKKWSIDSYSHPKLAIVLPNDNYCIIGEGDNGTYIAQIDPSGNLLSYKYGLNIAYPYQCKVISSDSIELIDYGSRNLKVNLSNNIVSLEIRYPLNYGSAHFINENQNFLDQITSCIYLDLESNQMGCFDRLIENGILSELTVYPSSIVNETIIMENSGTIGDYTPTITTTNDVSMTLTCSSLGIDETKLSALKLYPNPSINHQNLTIEFEKSSAKTIQIRSVSGNLVDSFELNGISPKVTFTAPQLSGMYFVQALDATGNIIAVEKLVVE